MDPLKRILLAEDSLRDAELVLDALDENGLGLAQSVVHVQDGAETLDYLYRRGSFADRPPGQPALVLLDLKMPRVDGLEVLRQIKDDPELKLIPVVAMTSSAEEKDLLKSYQLGVNAYVVKPVKFDEFADAVKNIAGFWTSLNQPPPGSLRKGT